MIRRWIYLAFYDWSKGMPTWKRVALYGSVTLAGIAATVIFGLQEEVGGAEEAIHSVAFWLLVAVLMGALFLLNGLVASDLERKIEAEGEVVRQGAELERAREIQLASVPSSPPVVPGLELAAEMETATEVGGDYYDFYPGDPGRLRVVLGDATGHGLPAGIMVAMTRSALTMVSGTEPAGAMAELGRTLRRVRPERMLMALTLLDLSPDEVVLCSAGMPPPLLRRGATGRVEELDRAGPPLGSSLAEGWESLRTGWEPGDVLVAFSDGLEEEPDASGTALGEEAVRRCLEQVGGSSAREIRDALMELSRSRNPGESPADDRTVVVIRRVPAAG